jgi:hypothetical protein
MIKLDGLNEWRDFDGTLLVLGKSIGIFGDKVDSIMDVKPILWSNNPVGNCLYDILNKLIILGYILHDKEEDKFKINSEFDPWTSAWPSNVNEPKR